MPVSADTIQEHLRYTAWASNRLVHAVEFFSPEDLNHDFKFSEHSILGTLVHTFAADRVWLRRLQGDPPKPFLDESDYDLKVLQIDWPLLYERWLEWANAQTDDSLAQPLTYHNLKGEPRVTPIFECALHVVNHGTHHRGQVSGMIRALGHVPPQLDLIRYCWEPVKLAK